MGEFEKLSRDERAVPCRATTAAAPYEGLAPVPVVVLLENVRSLYNVGAFFRTADGMRAQRIYLCGFTGAPPERGIAKTALGAELAVPWERHRNAVQVVSDLRGQGYEIAAVETSPRAVDLFDWVPAFPVCVLFGHETEGLSPALLAQADTHVRLPMLGIKQSLNVATAGGIVLYELLRKYRAIK